MSGDLEDQANDYRAFLRDLYGKDIPVYTSTEVSVEDGMVRLDLMGSDGVAVRRLNAHQVMNLIEQLELSVALWRGRQ